jgi:hypothetical protein
VGISALKKIIISKTTHLIISGVSQTTCYFLNPDYPIIFALAFPDLFQKEA